MALPRATSEPTFDMFIGNFPATLATQADKILRDQYSCCGAIQSVEVRCGSRGDGAYVGFVRFTSEEARARAIDLTFGRGVIVGGAKLFSSLPRGVANKGASNKVDGERNLKQLVRDENSKSDDSTLPFLCPVGEADVLVTHIESICHFWGQIASNEMAEAVATMTTELCTVNMSPAVGVLAEDKLYAAQFEGDMCWYRCKLLRQVSNDQCEVFYVDYGNTEVIKRSSVMELPQKFAVPEPFATRYWLIGYQAAPVPPAKLEEGMKMMETLKDTLVTCQFFPSCPSLANVIPVRAMSNAIEIGPHLFQGEYIVELTAEQLRSMYVTQAPAVTKPGQSVNKSRSSSSVGSAENVPGLMPTPPHHGGQRSNQVNGNPIPLNPPPNQRQFDSQVCGKNNKYGRVGGNVISPVPSLMTDCVRSGTGDSKLPTQAVQVVKDTKLLSENAELRRELNRLKEENFVWQQKQKTLTELQRNHGELKNELTDLKKNSLLLKLEALVKNIKAVSMLRAQFPSNTEMKDCLEAGYELVSDNESRLIIVNFPALAEINSFQTSYQASQAAISAIKDKADVDSDTLDGLIAVRNESRLVLYQKLEEFLSASREVPLSEKGKQIEAALLAIRATYRDYLVAPVTTSCDGLSLTMSEYSSMKVKKAQVFEDCRIRTDQCRREAASAMNRISKLLISSDIENKSLPDLEKVINSCQTAIEIELKITNEAQTADEKALITNAVKSLVHELDRELLDIKQISEAYTRYAELCIELRMWLTDKPDVEDLHACIKRIKILKSKLRHLLADRADAQEGVSSVEELYRIDNNLSELREQLQNEYATEDLLLNHAARLATEHFPELFLQYPEFNLSSIVEYAGLVKMGRALDQFDLSRLCEGKANVHKSVVCGKPVVLKEFIIGESVGVKRDDFLRRVLAYSQVGDVGILQPQGLFEDQADRLFVLHLPYMEHNLSSFVGSRTLTSEAAYGILDGVLSGLEALHLAKLVHGAVHPNNVLIDASGRGVLAEYDFTKIPLRRVQRNFTTSSGIKFVVPEVSSAAITSASDMYNFGLLILWMHHPDRKFVLGQMNLPNISSVELPNGLSAIVKTLLQATPTRRPSASQLRKEKYFMVPPMGYRSDDSQSNDMPSKDAAKESEHVDDDLPSSGSEDTETEDSLLVKKKDSSRTLHDSSVDSNVAVGFDPASEKNVCVDLVGDYALTELSNPVEWSDKLTDESISSSNGDNANTKA